MKKQRFTDVGNARRLAARFKKEIRYVPSWGWFRWTGARWSRDKTGHVERCAKQIIEDMFVRAEQLKNKKLAQALKKHAKRCEANARIKAMIDLAKTESSLVAIPEKFDRDQWLFNCSNGTLNLRTGYLRKHRSRDYLTRLSPVEYDESAECPRWLSFLDRIMKGDEELIEFLHRAIGYSLTGDTGAQCFFILFGTGANGKTTFLETIRRLFGDYAKHTPTDTLMLKRPGTIPNDLARLHGVRFVTATETEANRHLGEEQVKQLTGSDIVVARFLHREFFEYRPAFKLFLATNHQPIIRGDDHAIWRRIKLVPFAVRIAKKERDPDLQAKLCEELPGILRWSVEGCRIWLRKGLGEPTSITTATDEYRREMDSVRSFLTDCCERKPGGSVGATPLYEAYRWWCKRNGLDAGNPTAFGRSMTSKGFERRRHPKSRRKLYVGLRLAAEGVANDEAGTAEHAG